MTKRRKNTHTHANTEWDTQISRNASLYVHVSIYEHYTHLMATFELETAFLFLSKKNKIKRFADRPTLTFSTKEPETNYLSFLALLLNWRVSMWWKADECSTRSPKLPQVLCRATKTLANNNDGPGETLLQPWGPTSDGCLHPSNRPGHLTREMRRRRRRR